jgi:OmpR-family two-component system manganese-sensing sensor histidine kinase
LFKKLKRRLVLLYGITTSVILTVIIIGISVINYKQNSQQEEVLFQKNTEQIIEKVRSDNIINNTWMLQKQSEDHYIILIEENGKRLTSSYQAENGLDTELLAKRIKDLAAAEGIRLDRRPLYSKVEKTPVITLDYGPQGSCLGIAVNIPTQSGWQNIMIFSGNSLRSRTQTGQILFFAIVDLIGIAALFLISSLYISKVIRPLEEGQEQQNAFIAAASHELRSPLTVIKTGVSSIREDVTKAGQFLGHVEEECDRMTRLINDMLLLAAADARHWKLDLEPVDMDTLLIECYDMICACLNERQIDITLELPEEALCTIYGDKVRIKQILTILMDNAMSHSPEGKKIAIRAFQQKHSMVLEVEDHGRGISEEEKKHVFERFYRGDQSRTGKKHFGLGLSIAKELVELHEGDIFIRDTPGGGATFVVRFPI